MRGSADSIGAGDAGRAAKYHLSNVEVLHVSTKAEAQGGSGDVEALAHGLLVCPSTGSQTARSPSNGFIESVSPRRPTNHHEQLSGSA
jgi:hypothetical protein